MKLTDDMIKLVMDNSKKCIIYSDDYVLLYKAMPCTDEKLEDYINTLNKLSDGGVNVSNIVDYKLVGPTNKFSNGSYTKGVFLEKRAKGKCIAEIDNLYTTSKNEKIDDISNIYLEKINTYLDELEKRSKASEEVYDKLVNDYINIFKVGLSPDPKPLNFFFDENYGYTIIDVIDVKSNDINKELEHLSRIMYLIVFGYDFPRLSVNYNYINIIPKEQLDRFNKIIDFIEDKLMYSLLKNGIDKNQISGAIISNRRKYSNLEGVDNYREIIYEKINEIKNNMNDKENPLNFTF